MGGGGEGHNEHNLIPCMKLGSQEFHLAGVFSAMCTPDPFHYKISKSNFVVDVFQWNIESFEAELY